MTLLMLLLTAATAWADVTISSTAEWETFANAVSNGTTYSGQIVTLTKDITVTTMAGSSQTNSFQGFFYGGGHTLTFNATTTAENCAPFAYINGATLQDMIDILMKYGAYNAANLDGGHSTSLTVNGKLYNNPPSMAKNQGGRYVVTGFGLIP